MPRIGSILLTLACLAMAGASPERKPNILYFVVDELGYYELSCMGHPHFQTPNIDRLAAQGIRFTQGLAGAPVCAPTRCTLMTGKHMGHASVRKNDGGTPLRLEEPTIASVLKQVGYATGGFGKWGCGGRGSTGVPEKHGFDVFFGYYDQVHAHTYYPPYLIRNSAEVMLPGNHGGRSGKTYSHYVIVEEGKKFIRENKDRPFFCYMPVTPPHGWHDIPETDPSWQLYKDKPWPHEAKVYAAMVNMVDRHIGEFIELLKEIGQYENTIIVVSGDNGGHSYFADAEHPRGFHAPNVDPRTGVEFRGGKGNLYEGGLRVPMIWYWPGHIEGGRVSDLLWYFPDVLPTLAELTGAKAPADIDGISIVPELLGESVAGRPQQQHRYLYWEYGGQVAVREGTWKAIRPGRNRPWELYNLAEDVSERHNLADQYPDVLRRLQQFAAEAHEEPREGIFYDRALHEKDRRAKFGAIHPDRPVRRLPRAGLLRNTGWRIVSFSSESTASGRLARHAIDGDPLTWWHSEFTPVLHKHPHELIIDLGQTCEIRGFYYLARQDGSWNGTIRDCEFYVSDRPDSFGPPVVRTTLQKTKEPQRVDCPPVRGRYVRVVALSEVNGGPWASIAELGVIGRPLNRP